MDSLGLTCEEMKVRKKNMKKLYGVKHRQIIVKLCEINETANRSLRIESRKKEAEQTRQSLEKNKPKFSAAELENPALRTARSKRTGIAIYRSKKKCTAARDKKEYIAPELHVERRKKSAQRSKDWKDTNKSYKYATYRDAMEKENPALRTVRMQKTNAYAKKSFTARRQVCTG